MRREIYALECPKPVINPQSLAWIEAYVVQKRIGFGNAASLPARDLDAFLMLEELVSEEKLEIVNTVRIQLDHRSTESIKC
jgi:hypothetical protein